MSFLFKSKQQKGPSSYAPSQPGRSSDSPSSQIPTFNGSLNGSKPTSPTTPSYLSNAMNPGERATSGAGAGVRNPQVAQYAEEHPSRNVVSPTPEPKMLRERENEMNDYEKNARNTLIQARPSTLSDASPYPWSQRRLNFPVSGMNPFPRYGAAVNASSGKDGVVYMMGGLINGSTVKGDLWMIEAGNGSLSCYQVATTSEGPGPRVGHASLLVGNAFIVFGGDTKMDEGDMLDDTLYLLNTSTKQWSRALPAGPRPPGRYGHTLNILGSRIYIFGGQVEGYFFNDLVAFDLNALQQTTNHWDVLIPNTIDGGPPHGQIPPARTNHTMINWGDKLFLFGGTDGVHWFNDVWAYTPQQNAWTQLDCIGYIPSPREGHAAALVGDVMYIFGGRNEEGSDLGDLAAFRITTKRWYTFQNMGPSPSPRSGHSMTTVGKTIVVLAGEPSSAPRDAVELAQAYFLDTTKIRYPADASAQQQISAGEKTVGNGRPSVDNTVSLSRGSSKDQDNPRSDSRLRADSNSSRLPRAAGSGGHALAPAPIGPPPQAPLSQGRSSVTVASRQPSRIPERPQNQNAPDSDQQARYDQPEFSAAAPPPYESREDTRNVVSPDYENNQRFKPETYVPSQVQSRDLQGPRQNESPSPQNQTVDRVPPVRPPQRNDLDDPQDSGIGSSPAFVQQHDDILRDLDRLKQKNAWYASELALARKSGYQTRETDSPALDDRAVDSLRDEDRPLVEALLKMRAELTRVQDAIDEQSKRAAARIAEVEKQRDTAVSEAVFAKAKLAGHGSPNLNDEAKRSLAGTPDRSNDMSRRLASSIAAQSEFSQRIGALMHEVESEKASRQLAEDMADATQKRVSELEQHRQQSSAELERLRSALHEAQREHRELTASHTEISSKHRLNVLENTELSEKLQNAQSSSEDHTTALSSLRDAVNASSDKAQTLEQKLDEERRERDALEQELQALKIEHENNRSILQTTTKRLRDAEDLTAKHAEEARTHREAVLVGLGRVSEQNSPLASIHEERVAALQEQATAASAIARQNQIAADTAAEKLRSAEERIAGLEAYQEQASRESLSIRKQLQTAIKDNQGLNVEKNELQQKFQGQVLETNALRVQHTSLKDILGERGINAAEMRRSRAVDSPSSLSKRFSTPDIQRVKELEQQLEASLRTHDEMRAQFEDVTERDEKLKREYEEKLTALDNDHQAAVKYLRGTEKMLSKMKQELQRVKNENGEMRKRLERSRGGSRDVSPMLNDQEREQFETEQTQMKTSITGLETRLQEVEAQLTKSREDLEKSKAEHATTQTDLNTLRTSHDQGRADLEHFKKENSALEERARDAEKKVQLLLDQVEHSVDNYRRQSQLALDGQATTMNGVHHSRSFSAQSAVSAVPSIVGHSRNMSDGGHSVYSLAAEDDMTDGRNSLALDSLASELDALRSHWETTKNYRISDKFDFERAPAATTPTNAGGLGGSLATWRQDLDISDDGSRPGTSEGTIRDEHNSRLALHSRDASGSSAHNHKRIPSTAAASNAAQADGGSMI